MARYTGPDCRRCRREKTKLYLKGAKCDSPKCPIELRPYPPGVHGRARTKTGENLLRILETRLDNVVYRAGFATSRDMARQLVRHGHFVVNGHKVDIPSFRVSEHDIVEVRGKSVEMTPFVVARAQAGERSVPAWIESIPTQMRILIHSLPARQVIDTQVQEQLIVELYSKN